MKEFMEGLHSGTVVSCTPLLDVKSSLAPYIGSIHMIHMWKQQAGMDRAFCAVVFI